MSVVLPTPGRPVNAMRPLIVIEPHSILFIVCDNDAILRILDEEIHRHPHLEAGDFLKLIYQAAFGGDHLLARPGRFRKALAEEWTSLESGPSVGAALQRIDPEGRVARIHLEPCRRAGIGVRELGDLLLDQPWRFGTYEMFRRLWKATIECVPTVSSTVTETELEALSLPDGPPHHSEAYGRANYRILNDVGDPATRVRLVEWGLLP